jgi:hypothetical protein
MEFVRPKIEWYRTRTFSEKISDTFAFIRESWRPMLKYFTYLLLPVSIVMAFFMNNFMDSYMRTVMGVVDGGMSGDDYSSLIAFGLTTLGLVVVSVVGSALLTSLTFALIRLYNQRGELRLEGLTGRELKPVLMAMLRRVVRLLLAWMLIVVLVGVLLALLAVLMVMISPVLMVVEMLLVYALLLAVILPLSLVVPIYLLEDDISVLEAFQKAWRLGFATWGGVFAVVVVLTLIGSVISSFTSLPWSIMFFAKTMFTLRGETAGGFVGSMGYSFLQYLMCIVQCFCSLLISVITLVGITVQYGHASDKIDGVGVAKNIEKFDELDEV